MRAMESILRMIHHCSNRVIRKNAGDAALISIRRSRAIETFSIIALFSIRHP